MKLLPSVAIKRCDQCPDRTPSFGGGYICCHPMGPSGKLAWHGKETIPKDCPLEDA